MKFKMPGSQTKITRHADNKENTDDGYDEEKNQPNETEWQMTEMIKLADKDFKTAIVNVFHMFKKYEHDEKINRKF